jgi:hypothetical protein
VNEQECPVTTDPLVTLPFLRGRVSDRKLRLFAVACCWSLERVLCDEAGHLLRASERFADDPGVRTSNSAEQRAALA